MKRLHLGCGKVYLPGWENVDMFSHVKADAYHDITALPYEKDSFDLIYASHILEHVHRHMVIAVLAHWRSLLKDRGVLRLAVPDFAAICDYYRMTGELKPLIGLIYGGQDFPLNSHNVTFDQSTLENALRLAGFGEIRSWDWHTTDHAQFDDFSQAYLPHMDKETGRLMSLNVEAVK